jgi:DNA-binding winged helix-turn-helix (wHTH) protein
MPQSSVSIRLRSTFDRKNCAKNGMRLRLSGQPFQVLAVLIDHAGEVVTREELHSQLWKVDTFVDFDHGLNNAIARIREVLDDSSGTPRYVETIPRRGYRFISTAGGCSAVDSLCADSRVDDGSSARSHGCRRYGSCRFSG